MFRSCIVAVTTFVLSSMGLTSCALSDVWVQNYGGTLVIASTSHHDYVELQVAGDAIRIHVIEFHRDSHNPLRWGRLSNDRAVPVGELYQELPLDEIESLWISTSGGNDVIHTQVPRDTHIYAGSGHDQVNMFVAPNDRPINAELTIIGGSGSDELFSNYQSTTIHGDDGDDVIFASTVESCDLRGGDGADYLVSFAQTGTVEGNADADLIKLQTTGSLTVEGGPGDDRIDASRSTGATIQFGGPDDDLLVGGSALDQLFGGEGDDDLYGMADVLYEYDRGWPRVRRVVTLSDGQRDIMAGGEGADDFYDRFLKIVRIHVLVKWGTKPIFSTKEIESRWIEEDIQDLAKDDDTIETDLDWAESL